MSRTKSYPELTKALAVAVYLKRKRSTRVRTTLRGATLAQVAREFHINYPAFYAFFKKHY